MEESDIPNLPYIQAIVRETLGPHPGFTVLSRQSSQDCTVAGYHIPANTELLVNVWARTQTIGRTHSSSPPAGFLMRTEV